MDDNLMFRWLVGLGIDDPIWLATVFTKNRERLRTTDMSRKVMAAILAQPEVKPLLSDTHFPVDGPVIKAWASIKSFQPKAPPEDDEVDSPPPPPTDQTPPQKARPTRNARDPTDAKQIPQCCSRFQGPEAVERAPCGWALSARPRSA